MVAEKTKVKYIQLQNPEDCCGCGAFYNVCPKSAIEMKSDAEGFWYPSVSQEKCINCGLCRKTCPILSMPTVNTGCETYGAFASNAEEQMTSTSGGVFAVLARSVLRQGGYVCGVAFSEDFSVQHIIIHDEEDLTLLKGVKYVQSSIGDCFQKIKRLLHQGCTVLFSGTPCQVGGLKAFLNQDHPNLICVDLICHGVPSPGVWQRYLAELAASAPITEIEFRHKDAQGMWMRLKQNGQYASEPYHTNRYIQGFLKNYYVRPSCFHCRFKGLQRCSDITVGDFWGVMEHHADFSNGNGVSSVILHSAKGKRCIEINRNALEMIAVSKKDVELWNECLLKSTPKTDSREVFFQRWRQEGVANTVQYLLQQHQQTKPVSQNSGLIRRIKCFFRG